MEYWPSNTLHKSSSCVYTQLATWREDTQQGRTNSRKTLTERHSRDSKWISCNSCVQFQISLVIGWHRISAASAKMVSSGVKLEFATPALWRFGKMECSHLWHQPRQAHWYCFFCSEWKQLTRETNSWAKFLNIMLQQGKITRRVQRNRLLCQAQKFNPCLQRKVHFSVERTGRSRKNCYSFQLLSKWSLRQLPSIQFLNKLVLARQHRLLQIVLVEKAENKLHNPVSAQGCFKRLRHT